MQISIIVPIYQVEAYLEECLQSLLDQTYKNLDIVLIDDGSIDKSLDIAMHYVRLDTGSLDYSPAVRPNLYPCKAFQIPSSVSTTALVLGDFVSLNSVLCLGFLLDP